MDTQERDDEGRSCVPPWHSGRFKVNLCGSGGALYS